jgi:phenylacetate-CoA ligase
MDIKENIKNLLRYPYSLIPYKHRLHQSYYSTKKFLKKKFSNKKYIEHYQLKKLKEIIFYAYKNCPGYYDLYNESNIKPNDLNKVEDIKYFPLITKEILRDNIKDFVSRDVNLKKKSYVTTSGSSGIPFGFYNTKEEYAIELAFIHDAWEKIGWKLGDKSMVLRGSYIGSKKELSHYNPSSKQLHISSYYLTQQTYKDFKNLYFSSQIKDIQAFPSAAINLANLVIENNDIGIIKIRFIFLGSENFNFWQEKRIYKAFPDVTILIWYGQTEKCSFAVKNPNDDFYRVNEKYGFSEIIKNTKNLIFNKSEIISTSFFIKATPFIRYRTLDFASGKLNKNGSVSKIFEIEGRKQEYILTKLKKKIYVSSWASILHNDIFDKIKEFQFYQYEHGKVILKIVPKKKFIKTDSLKMLSQLKKKFGKDLDIKIKKVSYIQKTTMNKHSFIKNETFKV